MIRSGAHVLEPVSSLTERQLMRAEELPPLAWRKAQRSMSNGACVEVAPTAAGVVVRDSQDPYGLVIGYAHEPWKSFVIRARSGSFDFPCRLSRAEAFCSYAFFSSRLFGMLTGRRHTPARGTATAGQHRRFTITVDVSLLTCHAHVSFA